MGRFGASGDLEAVVSRRDAAGLAYAGRCGGCKTLYRPLHPLRRYDRYTFLTEILSVVMLSKVYLHVWEALGLRVEA